MHLIHSVISSTVDTHWKDEDCLSDWHRLRLRSIGVRTCKAFDTVGIPKCWISNDLSSVFTYDFVSKEPRHLSVLGSLTPGLKKEIIFWIQKIHPRDKKKDLFGMSTWQTSLQIVSVLEGKFFQENDPSWSS
jgi:hypothetical protein